MRKLILGGGTAQYSTENSGRRDGFALILRKEEVGI